MVDGRLAVVRSRAPSLVAAAPGRGSLPPLRGSPGRRFPSRKTKLQHFTALHRRRRLRSPVYTPNWLLPPGPYRPEDPILRPVFPTLSKPEHAPETSKWPLLACPEMVSAGFRAESLLAMVPVGQSSDATGGGVCRLRFPGKVVPTRATRKSARKTPPPVHPNSVSLWEPTTNRQRIGPRERNYPQTDVGCHTMAPDSLDGRRPISYP